MSLKEAFEQFECAVGNLKRAFAEEFSVCSEYVAIHIDDGDDVTIFCTNRSGSWTPIYRDWADTDEKETNNG